MALSASSFLNIKRENGSVLRIKTIWALDAFEVHIIGDFKAWKQQVNEEHIKDLSEKYGIAPQDYFKNIKSYLTDANSEITADIVENNLFVYRTGIGTFKIKYFYVDLQELDYNESMCSFIDELHKSNVELSQELSQTLEVKKECEQDKLYHENKLKDFINKKEIWEKQLYGSFLLILNEKKKHIQFLTETLHAVNKSNSSISRLDLNENGSLPISTKKKEIISDSSSEYNTDEEEILAGGPSTSKQFKDVMRSDSPPRKLLPKRMKRIADVNPVECTFKRESPSPEDAEKKDENSPIFEASTQDILDRM